MDEAIISAFSDGVRNVKMKEDLTIHKELCTTLDLFNIATKCARAEEGHLSLLELPAASIIYEVFMLLSYPSRMFNGLY